MANLFNIYKILLDHFWDILKKYFKNWKSNLRHFITSNVKEKLIALTLSLFTFAYVRYQNVEERNLFVPLQIKKNDSLVIVNDLPQTVSLFVSGNRSALNNLDVNKIQAHIDLSDVTIPGTFNRSPILEDLPEGIQLIRSNPRNLMIELSNLEKKLLRIEPTLVGKPRNDFQIQNIEISPIRIWVLGPPDIINDITKIETEPIDIDNLEQDKQVTVSFSKNIHPGLKFDRDRRVDVLIKIESEYIRQNLVEPIIVQAEFSNNLMLSSTLKVSNISFKIQKEDLNDFKIDQDLTFYFDTSQIKKVGSYHVNIKVKRNKRIRAISYSPLNTDVEVVEN